MDVTQLILDDHHEQRRLFAMLDEIDRSDQATLGALWDQLADFLEVHAEAEEKHFYPSLLRRGQGAGSKADAVGETLDAIKDHNDIRDAVAQVVRHEVGTDAWYQAVAAARKANSTHMGEEERESLADFRRHAPLQTRHDLAVRFAAFEAAHRTGVRARDKDPEAYVRRAGSQGPGATP
ncbi:MAG TPA: hemerythrin domain-containing protein [Frateuria sp.]|uniref:hemerythrin domain-containing protein n=1 Tax=Frateuria sp. TaxID=2211372 RepID=UPI002D80BF50|nr:hemerythrin domain-containing protein [Frateuria sp.]HET6807122.1 hemerythrin domain-containing protein [Frateuria sp.]